MEFIIRGSVKTDKDIKPGTGKYSNSNPAFRKAYYETMERARNTDPRKLAEARRLAIKQMRFQGKTPELVAKSAALRMAISDEVNGERHG
jgi:hypothetical protein